MGDGGGEVGHGAYKVLYSVAHPGHLALVSVTVLTPEQLHIIEIVLSTIQSAMMGHAGPACWVIVAQGGFPVVEQPVALTMTVLVPQPGQQGPSL